MAHPRRQLSLPDKPFHILGFLLGDFGIENLDREQGVKHVMASEPDGSQTALSNLLFDYVAVERLPRLKHNRPLLSGKGSAVIHVTSLCFHRRTV